MPDWVDELQPGDIIDARTPGVGPATFLRFDRDLEFPYRFKWAEFDETGATKWQLLADWRPRTSAWSQKLRQGGFVPLNEPVSLSAAK